MMGKVFDPVDRSFLNFKLLTQFCKGEYEIFPPTKVPFSRSGQGGSRTHTPFGRSILSRVRLPFRHLAIHLP